MKKKVFLKKKKTEGWKTELYQSQFQYRLKVSCIEYREKIPKILWHNNNSFADVTCARIG